MLERNLVVNLSIDSIRSFLSRGIVTARNFFLSLSLSLFFLSFFLSFFFFGAIGKKVGSHYGRLVL